MCIYVCTYLIRYSVGTSSRLRTHLTPQKRCDYTLLLLTDIRRVHCVGALTVVKPRAGCPEGVVGSIAGPVPLAETIVGDQTSNSGCGAIESVNQLGARGCDGCAVVGTVEVSR